MAGGGKDDMMVMVMMCWCLVLGLPSAGQGGGREEGLGRWRFVYFQRRFDQGEAEADTRWEALDSYDLRRLLLRGIASLQSPMQCSKEQRVPGRGLSFA